MKRRTLFLLISLCMALTLLMQRSVQQRLTCWMGWCAYPIIKLAQGVMAPFETWRAHRLSKQELQALVKSLRCELGVARAENIALRGMMLHAAYFDDLVRWAGRYQASTLRAARVIGRLCSDERQQLFLDVGARDDIATGMIAVVENQLVGRVSDVYPSWCRVVAITDRASKIPIICSFSGTRAIYEGLNCAQQARLSFVSHLNTLIPGELVLSSGDGLLYPEGFAVGRVKAFELDRRGLHYEVDIAPLLDVTAVTHCYVVDKGVALSAAIQDPIVTTTSLDAVYTAMLAR